MQQIVYPSLFCTRGWFERGGGAGYPVGREQFAPSRVHHRIFSLSYTQLSILRESRDACCIHSFRSLYTPSDIALGFFWCTITSLSLSLSVCVFVSLCLSVTSSTIALPEGVLGDRRRRCGWLIKRSPRGHNQGLIHSRFYYEQVVFISIFGKNLMRHDNRI